MKDKRIKRLKILLLVSSVASLLLLLAAAFEEIQTALDAAGEPDRSFAIERLRGTNGFKGAEGGLGVNAFRAAIEARSGAPARFLTPVGAYDGRYFADDGIEIINVGPGAGSEGHASNESVPVAQLVDAAVIHLAVIEELLGPGTAD